MCALSHIIAFAAIGGSKCTYSIRSSRRLAYRSKTRALLIVFDNSLRLRLLLYSQALSCSNQLQTVQLWFETPPLEPIITFYKRASPPKPPKYPFYVQFGLSNSPYLFRLTHSTSTVNLLLRFQPNNGTFFLITSE